MLSLPDRPMGVFAALDDLTVEALETALSVGLTVREQLSVVSFDDVLLASLTAVDSCGSAGYLIGVPTICLWFGRILR